jgi:hypothetical protein
MHPRSAVTWEAAAADLVYSSYSIFPSSSLRASLSINIYGTKGIAAAISPLKFSFNCFPNAGDKAKSPQVLR